MKYTVLLLALLSCNAVVLCSSESIAQKNIAIRVSIDNRCSNPSKTFIVARLCNGGLHRSEALDRHGQRMYANFTKLKPLFENRQDRQVYCAVPIENPDEKDAQVLRNAINDSLDLAYDDYKGIRSVWLHYRDGSIALLSGTKVVVKKAASKVSSNDGLSRPVLEKSKRYDDYDDDDCPMTPRHFED